VWRAARREARRVGWVRFLDVMAFRLFARLRLAGRERRWKASEIDRLRRRYPADLDTVPRIVVPSPNSSEAQAFLERLRPDLAIARCKIILKRAIFGVPRVGTFVLHPGICPEYRNAHGCFWALATGDVDNVGMTLLRIDRGVDTGPVFGYFRIHPEPARESHVVMQHRAVLDHLDAIRDRLLQIEAGTADPLNTHGRKSAAWGQPWMTAYLRMRRA
jgi:methionyl-tRNA formyltransferase